MYTSAQDMEDYFCTRYSIEKFGSQIKKNNLKKEAIKRKQEFISLIKAIQNG